MTRNESFDTFTRDVDRLLHEAGRIDAAATDAEYRKDLALAAELAAIDFSSDSTQRAALRRQLVSGRATRQAASRERPTAWLWAWRQHPRLVTAVVSAVILVTVVMAQPNLRAAIVEPAIRYLQRLVLGAHTEAVVAAEPEANELDAILDEYYRGLEAGERWSIETAVGQLGGDVPQGRSAVIRTYNSLRLAEYAAAFTVAKPGSLPADYRFDRAVITPADGVVLWYLAPGGRRITLYQTPIAPGRATMTMSMGAGGTMEQTTVGGRPAAWVNDRQLVWEGESASFTLEGNALTRAEATSIAESVR